MRINQQALEYLQQWYSHTSSLCGLLFFLLFLCFTSLSLSSRFQTHGLDWLRVWFAPFADKFVTDGYVPEVIVVFGTTFKCSTAISTTVSYHYVGIFMTFLTLIGETSFEFP